jgi:hypothetical protein
MSHHSLNQISSTRHRRWFQFSFKSIFVLMLIVAAFFGGMDGKQRQMQRILVEPEQARADAEIQAERLLYLEQLSAVRSLWSAAVLVNDQLAEPHE